MSGLSATRGGLQTSIGANSLKKKTQLNKDTTSTVSGKSTMAKTVSANLRTASLNSGASQNMMSKVGSILSRPTSSSQVAITGSAQSSAQVTSRSSSANKKTGTSSANGFVKSGFSAQQNFKFDVIRRSHIGPLLDNGNFYSKRATQRQISRMGLLNKYQAQSPTKSFGEKAMELSMGIGAMATAVDKIWDMFDSKSDVSAKSGTDTSNNSNNNTGNVNTNTNNSSSISSKGYNMLQNAENSAELSSGIALAKNEKTKLENEQKTINKDIETQTVTNNELKDIFKQKESAAKTAKANRENAKTDLDKTKATIKSKEGSLATLEAQLATAPDVQKATIQGQISTIKAEIQKLKETEAQQVQDLDNAQKDEAKANEELTKASNDSAESQKTLNNLNTSLKANEAKIKNYENQIKTAQENLKKMQDKEAAEADKLQEAGLKNINSGMNKLEKGKNTGSKKVNKGTDKLNEGNTKEQLVALSKAPQVVANGKAFATTTDNLGKAIYSINGKLVSESEYKTQFEESKQQEIKAQLQSAPATNVNGQVLKTVTFEGTTVYSVNDSIVTKEEYDAAANASV